MAWQPIPFPPRLAMGVTCQPGWQVSVTSVLSGDESRNLDWEDARHEYDAGLTVRTEDDYQDVVDHWHMCRGQLHSFPLKDPVDFKCPATRGLVQVNLDDGSPVEQKLQLVKRYGSGDFVYDRRISRLIPGKFMLFNDGLLLVAGTDYTVDENTGSLTYTGDASSLSWSGQFYVPVRYDMDKLPTKVVNRRGNAGELLLQAESIPLLEVRDRSV